MGKGKIAVFAAALAAGLALNAQAGALFEGAISGGDERVTIQNDATAVSGGVEIDTTSGDNEWNEFLITVPEKITLGGGKTYKISYDYTVSKVKVDDARFYHLLRSGDDFSKDKAMELWTAKPGSKGKKEFTVVLKDSDYRLILGVRFGGAIRIENLKIEDASPAPLPAGVLLGGPTVKDERLVFQCDADAVSGGVEVDTTSGSNEWNEYLFTAADVLKLEAGKTYKVSYDYSVKKAGANSQLYHLFRTGSDISKDQGWEAWAATEGEKGHKEVVASLDEAGYRFILGVQFGAAVRIENLKIEDLSKKKK